MRPLLRTGSFKKKTFPPLWKEEPLWVSILSNPLGIYLHDSSEGSPLQTSPHVFLTHGEKTSQGPFQAGWSHCCHLHLMGKAGAQPSHISPLRQPWQPPHSQCLIPFRLSRWRHTGWARGPSTVRIQCILCLPRVTLHPTLPHTCFQSSFHELSVFTPMFTCLPR